MVRKCMSRDVLTTNHVRKFSKRAREYICAYQTLRQQQQQHEQEQQAENTISNATTTAEDDTFATPVKIEKLVKMFKTHRCALDFDRGFIDATFVELE